MATYKVIQDIEAEDHIIGPLTLRQFIFALIAVLCFYLCFLVATKGVAFLLILFLPPGLFFGFFAFPFGRDQPTEIWALAKIRFWFKPRKRIWDQSGIKELVTITVPKKVEHALTNGLTEHEVESRLKVLANTLDSRGWAIKNANLATATAAYPGNGFIGGDSDRLIDVNSFAVDVPQDNAVNEPDIMDETQSQVAQHFNQMIDETQIKHKQALINQMNTPSPIAQASNASSQWFMPQSNNEDNANSSPQSVYAPDVSAQNETAEEEAFVSKIKNEQAQSSAYSSNLRTLQPISSQVKTSAVDSNLDSIISPPLPGTPPLTDIADTAILSLANNNDLSVDTIAREAKRAKGEEPGQDEVVISLH